MTMGEIKFYNPDSYENIPYDKDGPHSPECIQEHFNHLFLNLYSIKSVSQKVVKIGVWDFRGLELDKNRFFNDRNR